MPLNEFQMLQACEIIDDMFEGRVQTPSRESLLQHLERLEGQMRDALEESLRYS